MKLSIKHLLNKSKEVAENKAFGKKEKLGEFYIPCTTCGKLISLNNTNCPRKIKKLIKRNLKTRTIAMMALAKTKPQCAECSKKKEIKPPVNSFKEAISLAEETSQEFKSLPPDGKQGI